jgi:hypothetical protein
LRVQIQGPNGATSAAERWCATVVETQGKIFVPYTSFTPSCWETTAEKRGTPYAMQPISAVVFNVPGKLTATPYEYCVNGFADGSAATDAPDGPAVAGDQKGVVGSTANPDGDFARAKVVVDGKSYIIQNNNWGNPSGSDQKISYVDNSFKVDSSSGSGSSAPASFPSIYIGANGDTQNGNFSTSSDDNLPKQVSTITTIPTKFSYTKNGGNYNATYDVWFSANKPAGRYNDGISGFVMVWLYKPSGNQPIGSVKRTASIAGKTWDVWVGPRGGSGSNSNAPVVSYVIQGAVTSLSFDLKQFIADASMNGIMSSWYLTDVFAGFEIWDGNGTTGLGVSEFTASVQ